MGLAKNLTLFGLAAIAHNIAKGSKFLTLYGMPSPEPTG
jgi:IS5 family transposase